jgi:hypothetical protein
MSLSGDRLAHAEARSDAARETLLGTAQRLKARLSPKRLVVDAVQEVRGAGEALAQNSVDTAKQHPRTLIGALAGLALLLLRRKIAKQLRRRAFDDETASGARSLTSKRAKAPRRRRSA